MKPLHLTAGLLATLLLAGCARQPVSPVEDFPRYSQRLAAVENWELHGKMNLRVPDDSETVRIRWRNRPDGFAIRLSGALGMGATRIRGDDREVRLERSGEPPVVAGSAEELAYRQLGRTLPIAELYYWVRGLPAPELEVESVQFNSRGLVSRLTQSGWQLEYDRYQSTGQWRLPGRIVARHDDLRLTVLVSDWEVNPGETVQ